MYIYIIVGKLWKDTKMAMREYDNLISTRPSESALMLSNLEKSRVHCASCLLVS